MHDDTIKSIYEYPDYYPVTSPGCEGDVDFYVQQAVLSGGPVLEVGCGTGRILSALGLAGLEVVGIDNCPAMLARCRAEIKCLGQAAISTQLVDARSLDIRAQFGTAIIPYRTFLHLYSAEDQLEALSRIYGALRPGGKLIFNVFDPDVRSLAEYSLGSPYRFFREGVIPATGVPLVTSASTRCDLATQMIDEIWRYEELDADSNVARTSYGRFEIRYLFRSEAEQLLGRVGFEVENLYGDFDRSAYRSGREQIWICRKP